MSLSEEEQRILQQMEQQLRSESPRLHESLSRPPTPSLNLEPRRIALGGALLLVGLVILVAGVASTWTVVGILGFGVMVAGVLIGISPAKHNDLPAKGPSPKKPKSSSSAKQSFMDRQAKRWDTRHQK